MVSFVLAMFSAFLVGLAVASGIRFRARLKRRVGPVSPVVDDDAVRRILSEGTLTTDEDEPLDYDEIDEEERRFWSSDSWDEPDEW